MSNEAVQWAMDDAPMLRTAGGKADTTARHVLQALAEHAHKDGSNAHPSVLRIQYRTGYDRTTVQRALRRLEKGGLIKKDGVAEGRSRWRLAVDLRRPATDWQELEREEESDRAAASERKRRSRAKSVTHSESVTVTDAEGVTVTDSASVTPPMSRTQSPAVTDFKSVRHAPSAALTTNQPSDNQLPKDSSSPAACEGDDEDLFGRLAAASKATQDRKDAEDLKPFGDFWLVYPKKRDRGEALKAWRAAVASGVDPAHITAAAQRYAHERRSEDPKFTKYPATWLNKGCYDDEPDPQPEPGRPKLHAVNGSGYQPYQQPATGTDYSKGF